MSPQESAAGVSEEWRPVPGYPDYEVSALGRVRSHRRHRRPYLLRGTPGRGGYLIVCLSRDEGMPVKRAIHRLVAAAFHGPRPDGQHIRHLDGNHLNNEASNLTYGTPSQNILDQVAHGRHNMASKTHCPSNHEYTRENTYVFSDGRRRCKTCHLARGSARRAAA